MQAWNVTMLWIWALWLGIFATSWPGHHRHQDAQTPQRSVAAPFCTPFVVCDHGGDVTLFDDLGPAVDNCPPGSLITVPSGVHDVEHTIRLKPGQILYGSSDGHVTLSYAMLDSEPMLLMADSTIVEGLYFDAPAPQTDFDDYPLAIGMFDLDFAVVMNSMFIDVRVFADRVDNGQISYCYFHTTKELNHVQH